MKRILIVLLSAVMVLSLAACGGNLDSGTNQTGEITASEKAETTRPSATEPPTDEPSAHIPVVINPSPNKYTWYIKDYVGKNAASFGYTSLGGDRRDSYGAATLKLVFVMEDGSYIDIEDEDALKGYVVTAQNLAPNTELKLTFLKNSDGEEYSNLVDCQNYEEIVLGVKKVGSSGQGPQSLKPIDPSPDKYTWYIADYVGRNLASCGYVSLGGDYRVSYGVTTLKFVIVADDGSYVDPEDFENLQNFTVTSQNIPPNTELKLEFLKNSDGEEYSNLVDRQSYEEIVLGVKKIGSSSQGPQSLTPIDPSPDKYTWYIADYVGRNLAACGYVSWGGDYRASYGATSLKFIIVADDGSYIDPEDFESLQNFVVTGQNISPNTELRLEFLKKSDGTEYDNLVDSQNIEEIELYVKRIG